MTHDAAPPRQKVGRPAAYTPEQLLQRLVQAAIDLLAEQGADADVSVAQIAARAKVSKRTVYTVISSKEELIAHMIRHDVAAVTEMLAAPVASRADAHATLARFLAEWAVMACGPTAVGIFAMSIRERSRYPAIGAAYQRSRTEHGFARLAAWLARMDAKQFLRAPDADLTAEFMLTMVASERQRKLALGIDAPLQEDELARRVDAILRFVLADDLP
ncbi:MAG TPA: TetR/AcrR family transcriptional regulator [Telluria sp.]|jgi:AcrR family transcriptional regulator